MQEMWVQSLGQEDSLDAGSPLSLRQTLDTNTTARVPPPGPADAVRQGLAFREAAVGDLDPQSLLPTFCPTVVYASSSLTLLLLWVVIT